MPDSSRFKGITLAELLIAISLVTIVTLGITAFFISFNRLTDANYESNLVLSRLSSTMLSITRDASLAVGDVTNPGIQTINIAGNLGICFRHNTDNDPYSYTNDTYVCYSHDAANEVYRCDGLAAPSFCSAPMTLMVKIHGPGAVTDDFPVFPFVPVFFNVPTPLTTITITLSSASNTTQACDKLTNLCHSLTTDISPVSHGK